MANPLQQLDAVFNANVLDLYKTARDLIEQSDEVMSTFSFCQLVPDPQKAGCEAFGFDGAAQKKIRSRLR